MKKSTRVPNSLTHFLNQKLAMKENTKINLSVPGTGSRAPMENSHRAATLKAKSDPWSASRRVRLPHKPGVPLGSGGSSDGSSS
ncbi:hypothetical protein KME70_05980 [Ralstonia solanacearum]|uniref:Uncharacterized protein n=2 Tax=Ralstonia TaxID=48736 RepID=A0A0S4UE00_RALSL|nr:hypothetical protein HI812_07790 [Ralstonia solanacearum]QKM41208.1 hypothetical protein HI792_07725 [Ralstonia solanacearum]QWF13266.1 hypothetical protein KME70_05980 [Ralstonia solanacearum]CUV20374.1 conserved protein of unknown function [Ralstonia solanacearum]